MTRRTVGADLYLGPICMAVSENALPPLEKTITDHVGLIDDRGALLPALRLQRLR